MINLFNRVIGASCIHLLATGVAIAGPFVCSGDIYQVQSGQLRVFDPLLSQYVNVGTNQGSYNATGYNTLDDYAYGSQGNQWVIRIHGDGTVENVHNIGFGSFAGDVDYNNTLWLRRNPSRYDGVDLATGSVTTINFTGQTQNAADVAFVQNAGTNYLIAPGNTQVGIMNLDTGVSVRKPITGMPSSGGFGASWTDASGRTFSFHNASGEIYELFDLFSAAPYAVFAAQGDPSGNNDGFSCNQASFPNLPPIAIDDDFTTPINAPVSANVIPDNGNGADSDPENLPLSVNPVVVSNPTNGSVTINSSGNFTYTPNNNFVGIDTFEYQLIDASGLTDVATVTIKIDGVIGYSVTKKQSGGSNPITQAGQTIDYEITLENTGDIVFTNVTPVDTLPDGSIGTLTGPVETGATTPPAPVAGQLDIGETWVYKITYTVKQSDIDYNNELTNIVSVTTDETGSTALTGRADTPVKHNPALKISKIATAPGFVDGNIVDAPEGTIITYKYTVANAGNVTIENVSLGDVHNGSGPTIAPDGEVLSLDAGTVGDSTDASPNDGNWSVLAPGDEITFEGPYTITQADVDSL